MRPSGIAWVVMIALAGTVARADAQAPAGAERMSPIAVIDSLEIVHQLDGVLRKNRNDAAAWHRRGMVAWALWERSRHLPPIRRLDWRALGPMADSSLRIAALIAPDSAEYTLAALRFLLGSGAQFRRIGPYRIFGDAVDRARAAGNPAALANVALEAGKVSWLQYEHMYYCGNFNPDPAALPKEGAYKVAWRFREGTPDSGEIGYLRAELLFREAYDATPDSSRAFRQLAMLLVDRLRWRELASLARDQLNRGINRDWAWLAMGLARHELGEHGAAAAYDSGMVYLDSLERRRLFRFDRLLPAEERPSFAALTAAERSNMQAEYWRKADVLWSVARGDPRLEFFSRVTFAELRWTARELGINGVNTDMGFFYVLTGTGRSESCKPHIITDLVWNDSTVHDVIDPPSSPTWTGPPGLRIYTMPVQVARFRAPADSVDVMVASLPPFDAIQRSTDVAGPVVGYFWLFQRETAPVVRDTVFAKTLAVHAFTNRVAPGTYGFRVEASADGALTANRAIGSVVATNDTTTGFALRGFGLSDVVIAARANTSGSAARRWSDVPITPIPGAILRGTELSLLWEMYEASADAGRARYTVSITIERPPNQPSIAGRIAGAILGGIAGAVGIDRSEDRLTWTFDRDVAHRPVLVDNIAVTLADTPPGNYTLIVTVHERDTGRESTRRLSLTIVEPRAPRR